MSQEISKAASALGRLGGRSKSKKKLDAIAKNLEKANASLDKDARTERAKKAALTRWAKANPTAPTSPKTKTENK